MASAWVRDAFERARVHVGATSVFFTEFIGESAAIQAVVGDGAAFAVYEGRTVPAEHTFAWRVAERRAPAVIPDTAAVDDGQPVFGTDKVPGALVGAPVQMANGQVFGALVAAFTEPTDLLGRAETDMLGFLARIVANDLGRQRGMRYIRTELRARIRDVVASGSLRIAFQPIVCLVKRGAVGVEALSRFDAPPHRSPAMWFAEAHRVGAGVELEVAAARIAIREFADLPGHLYLSINASPETLVEPEFREELAGVDPARLVIEVTEHAVVANYDKVRSATRKLRRDGVRLGIDDLGSGYAGLSHLTGLRPDVIKIDGTIVRHAAEDPYHHSLLGSVSAFASGVGATTVGEGVETLEHLQLLAGAGISAAQGYLFAEPVPAAEVLDDFPVLLDVHMDSENAGRSHEYRSREPTRAAQRMGEA